ncbi:hypothetical protein [Fodinicola feengrottensis]|uniref:hypothetical protein n=1 Tax=Fodinicola feengrottensis TaxID=435914 RepID=UPI0013D202F3|nr:hypothetical protein [Fodinicola feengrottensis]
MTELTVGGLERTFTIQPPSRESVPLVLVLHGADGTGSMMREWTSFDRQAQAWGWAVAYPDGYERGWGRTAAG